MKKAGKHSMTVTFLLMAILLYGCQRTDDAEMEVELEIETGSSEDLIQESGQDPDKEKNRDETRIETGTDIATERSDLDDDLGTDLLADDDPDGSDLPEDVSEAFYYTALTEEIRTRITGKSYPDTEEPLEISYEDLAYVHVLHYDFQVQVREGELICNQAIAQDLVDIFYELYESRYPIEKIRLIDEYDADDDASMADNNTSCFNYRTVSGRTKLSNHSYGCAIDINPVYNPYVRTRNGEVLVSPDNAVPYADRSLDFPHKIDKDDLCCRIFMEHGFEWGGTWNSSKDYQHFEKMP